MFLHIDSPKDSFSDLVLMPGDPVRAEIIAKKFLSDIVLVNTNRNMSGYTGYYKNRRVSVQASGMGQASLGIYAHELYKHFDVKTIIRVGTCGGISSDIQINDEIVALSAVTNSSMYKDLTPHITPSPFCTLELLIKYYQYKTDRTFFGQIFSSDLFYSTNNDILHDLKTLNVLAIDMETFWLYNLANMYNRNALSVCKVSDIIGNEDKMSNLQRSYLDEKFFENILNFCVDI